MPLGTDSEHTGESPVKEIDRIMDQIPPKTRSAMMSRVRGKNTKPELTVRSLAHRMGYRFRLHRADLPGRPDMAFPSRMAVVFVHGCFWHQHKGCPKGTVPASRPDFWLPKLQRNVERDGATIAALDAMGWRSLVIWECELKDAAAVVRRLRDFLG